MLGAKATHGLGVVVVVGGAEVRRNEDPDAPEAECGPDEVLQGTGGRFKG